MLLTMYMEYSCNLDVGPGLTITRSSTKPTNGGPQRAFRLENAPGLQIKGMSPVLRLALRHSKRRCCFVS